MSHFKNYKLVLRLDGIGESDEVDTGEHTEDELAVEGDLECLVETRRVCCACDWDDDECWEFWGGGEEVGSVSGSCSGDDESFGFLLVSTLIDEDDEPLDDDDKPSYFLLFGACL